MARKKYRSTGGPKGAAEVKPLKNFIKVSFDDIREYPEPFEIPYPEGKDADDFVPGRYYVRLNQTEDKLYGLSLIQPGNYVVRVREFVQREDQPPAPKFVDRKGPYTSQRGGTYWIDAHEEFYIILEVQSGAFEGQQIFLSLWYLFEEHEDSGKFMLEGRRRNVNELESFLQATGTEDFMDNSDWVENFLPDLEDEILRRGRNFLIEINDAGYTGDISEMPEGMVVDKKPKKKAKKK